MSRYLGDFALGQTVRGMFSTGGANGGRIAFFQYHVKDGRITGRTRSYTGGFTAMCTRPMWTPSDVPVHPSRLARHRTGTRCCLRRCPRWPSIPPLTRRCPTIR